MNFSTDKYEDLTMDCLRHQKPRLSTCPEILIPASIKMRASPTKRAGPKGLLGWPTGLPILHWFRGSRPDTTLSSQAGNTSLPLSLPDSSCLELKEETPISPLLSVLYLGVNLATPKSPCSMQLIYGHQPGNNSPLSSRHKFISRTQPDNQTKSTYTYGT